jgi:hypothetical protein
MFRVRPITVRTVPPQQPHCGTCLKTLDHLQRMRDVYECSRVDCGQRKGVTAAPCDKPQRDVE